MKQGVETEEPCGSQKEFLRLGMTLTGWKEVGTMKTASPIFQRKLIIISSVAKHIGLVLAENKL